MCHLVLKRIMLSMQLNKSHYKEISNSYNFWLHEYWAHFADCGSLVQKTCHLCGCGYNSLASQIVGIYTEPGHQCHICGRVTLRQTAHSQYKSETACQRLSAELSSSPPKQGWWGPGSYHCLHPSPLAFFRALSYEVSEREEFILTYAYSSTLNQKNQEWKTSINKTKQNKAKLCAFLSHKTICGSWVSPIKQIPVIKLKSQA